MKIYVKDGNTGHKIRLALPSRLIFGKFGQAIVKRAIKSELQHNSSDEECVADTNIDADGLGMAELDDTTSFDTFDEEEQLEQAIENADALPDNENPMHLQAQINARVERRSSIRAYEDHTRNA